MIDIDPRVQQRGAALVQDEARDKEMIDDLLAFKGRCDAVLERALGRGDMFVHALKDGFEHAVNVRQVRFGFLVGLCNMSRGDGRSVCCC
jgi:hypothetical protein